jgi:hypothetical protein
MKDDKKMVQFSSISKTLSCFLSKYELAPSDILAGMLLLREEQIKKKTNNQVRLILN